MFRSHARTALTNREGRVSRTAITVGVIGAAAAAVSAGLLLSSGSGPSGGAAVRGVIPPAPAEQVGSQWQDAVAEPDRRHLAANLSEGYTARGGGGGCIGAIARLWMAPRT